MGVIAILPLYGLHPTQDEVTDRHHSSLFLPLRVIAHLISSAFDGLPFFPDGPGMLLSFRANLAILRSSFCVSFKGAGFGLRVTLLGAIFVLDLINLSIHFNMK